MMLVDKETGKGYVEMEKVHRDKKEYASKAVGGTALGLSIGALGLQLLGGGLLNCGLFGNRATVAETAAIAGTAANEHYLERKQCADQVQFVNDMWRTSYMQQNQRFEDRQTIDIEPLLGKMTDNLIVAATKEYPDLFGGITIGNGKIKIGVPGIDKDIVLEAADIDHFKSCLK